MRNLFDILFSWGESYYNSKPEFVETVTRFYTFGDTTQKTVREQSNNDIKRASKLNSIELISS
jgi:hypothetical protein